MDVNIQQRGGFENSDLSRFAKIAALYI